MTDQKASKAEARYQATPNGSERCAGCTMFRSPSSCTSVQGRVARNGWCKYFKALARTKGSLVDAE